MMHKVLKFTEISQTSWMQNVVIDTKEWVYEEHLRLGLALLEVTVTQVWLQCGFNDSVHKT